MARKKTITREQILNAAYEIVATEGFSKFTARNIASQMKCSTQPIYLEFKNMDDVKNSLFKKIETYLREEIFNRVVTGDPLIDMNLNYIHFATTEPILYRSLYLEGHSGDDKLNEFSHDVFMKNIDRHEKLKDLDDKTKNAIFTGVWVVATGIAVLKTGNLINPEDSEIIHLLKDVIDSVIANKESQILTNHISKKGETKGE